MDLEEYEKRLRGVIADLQGGAHGDVMVQLANDSLTLIKNRIIEQGRNADGQPMKPYSTRPMMTNKSAMSVSAYNAIAGNKRKREALNWVVLDGKTFFILPQGYSQFRRLHGRQTQHVDYVFTGRMWSNIALRKDKSDLFGGVAVIGAGTKADQNKLENLGNQRGKVLQLSKEEIQRVGEIYDKGILQIFRNNGL